MSNVVPFRCCEVHEFPWGTAVFDNRSSRLISLFIKPDGQEIKVEHLNIQLHQNGIEFLFWKKN